MSNETAKYAAINSSQINTQNVQGVKSVGISSVRKVGIEPVYNMEVEDTHCFAANGLIIHNCEDALRYGCMTKAKYSIAKYF